MIDTPDFQRTGIEGFRLQTMVLFDAQRTHWDPTDRVRLYGLGPRDAFGKANPPWYKLGEEHPSNVEALWKLVETANTRGHNAYINRAIVPAGTEKRGTLDKDVSWVSTLIVDIDIRGDHAVDQEGSQKAPNPERPVAMEMVESQPAMTMLVDSGCGLHGYAAFDEPINVRENRVAVDRVAAGWKHSWESEAAGRGVNMDAGPLDGLAGTIRAVGSINQKTGQQVSILWHGGKRYRNAEDFLRTFPVPPEVDRARAAKEVRKNAPREIDPNDTRPGVRFAREVSVVDILRARAFEEWEEDRYYSRPGGDAPNIEVFDDGAKLQPYGDGAMGDWRIPPKTQLDSWGLFVRIFFLPEGPTPAPEDEFKAAAREAARFLARWLRERHTWDELLDEMPMLEHRDEFFFAQHTAVRAPAPAPVQEMTWEPEPELTAATTALVQEVAPAAEAAPISDGTPRDVTREEFDQALTRDAAEMRADPVRYDTGAGWVAVCGGTPDQHGLYREYKNGDGSRYAARAYDYIVWRPVRRQRVLLGDTGRRQPASTAVAITVEVIDCELNRYQADDLALSDVTNLEKIVEIADAPIMLPRKDDERAVKDLVRTLGRGSRDAVDVYQCTGWLAEPEKPAVFLTSLGGVTANGVVSGYTVEPAADEDSGEASGSTLSRIGWDHIPSQDELPDYACSLRGYFGIFRKDASHIAVGIVGSILEAFLNLRGRSALWIVGPFGGGKSLSLASGFTFIADMGAFDDGMTGSMLSSEAALLSLLAVSRNVAVFLDDHTISASKARAATSVDKASTVLRAGYSGAVPRKATSNGNLRAAQSANTTLIISAEQSAPAGSIADRTIQVVWKDGYLLSADESGFSPLDRWAHEFGRGKGRGLIAAFVSYLAGRIDAAGSLTAFSDENIELARSLRQQYPLAEGRTGELLANLLTGWRRFYDWAEEADILDVLPTWDEILTDMHKLAAGAKGGDASTATWTGAILDAVQDLLATGKGHLEAAMGGVPNGYDVLGWRVFAGRVEPQGQSIGQVSADGKRILLTAAGIKQLAVFTDRETHTGADLANLMHSAGAFANIDHMSMKAKASDGFRSQARGYAFEATRLVPALADLQAKPEEQEQPQGSPNIVDLATRRVI